MVRNTWLIGSDTWALPRRVQPLSWLGRGLLLLWSSKKIVLLLGKKMITEIHQLQTWRQMGPRRRDEIKWNENEKKNANLIHHKERNDFPENEKCKLTMHTCTHIHIHIHIHIRIHIHIHIQIHYVHRWAYHTSYVEVVYVLDNFHLSYSVYI